MQDKVYYYPNSKEWSLLPFKINNTQIPQHEIPYSNPEGSGVNNRLPYLDYAKAGILTSIEYPTGGKQEYEYELNDFTISNSQQLGCGLRVKSTTLKDENNRVQDKITYNYINADNTSSGEMIYPPNTGYPLARLFQASYDLDNHTITTNYNGLPNFISDKLYMLFKIYDMPSESPIRYKRIEKIHSGKGKEIIEFVDKAQTPFGNSVYTPFANINIAGTNTTMEKTVKLTT